jgi:aconitate hydratase
MGSSCHRQYTELGATTSVFPSDDTTREFLKQEEREDQWIQLEADEGATYDKKLKLIWLP